MGLEADFNCGLKIGRVNSRSMSVVKTKPFLIKEKLETAKAGPKVEFGSTKIMNTRGKVTAITLPISGEKLIENSANKGVSIVSNLSSF